MLLGQFLYLDTQDYKNWGGFSLPLPPLNIIYMILKKINNTYKLYLVNILIFIMISKKKINFKISFKLIQFISEKKRKKK